MSVHIATLEGGHCLVVDPAAPLLVLGLKTTAPAGAPLSLPGALWASSPLALSLGRPGAVSVHRTVFSGVLCR